MTLVKWINNRPTTFFDEIDNMFNGINIGFPQIFNSESWSPSFEVLNIDDCYRIRADLPGVSKKDVNIEVSENVLNISGERKLDNNSEISYGKFSRSFKLPEDVKYEQINAKMKDGVLCLDIPRVKPVKPKIKTISIK